MGIAAGMKDIVQDIVSSYEVRVAEVKGLKKEAKKCSVISRLLIEEMGTRLRKDLARDKAKMGAEVKAMRSGFESSHKEMSSALKKDLAEHTQGVRGEVAKLRQEIGASHQDMSAGLKKSLAQGAAARKSEAHVMLNDFQRSREETGVQLRKELADYDRGIKSEVAGMRQETIADLREARTTWQELGSNMQAKRGGAEILPKVAAPVAEVEIPDLEAKLLAAVNEYPTIGITLAEVAGSMGVATVVLGRVSRKLLGEGKIRKEDKAYFPAPAE